jgi:hypothetical protein
MLLTIKTENFNGPANRLRFIKFLSDILNAGSRIGYQPTTLNNSDREWTLDMNNNWWAFFRGEHTVEIMYRYQCAEVNAEGALAPWLIFTMGDITIQYSGR